MPRAHESLGAETTELRSGINRRTERTLHLDMADPLEVYVGLSVVRFKKRTDDLRESCAPFVQTRGIGHEFVEGSYEFRHQVAETAFASDLGSFGHNEVRAIAKKSAQFVEQSRRCRRRFQPGELFEGLLDEVALGHARILSELGLARTTTSEALEA